MVPEQRKFLRRLCLNLWLILEGYYDADDAWHTGDLDPRFNLLKACREEEFRLSPTKIHPAEIRSCLMNGADSKVITIKSEKRTCKRAFIKDSSIGKKFSFIRIDGDNLLDSGYKILYPVFKGAGLFHNTKNIGHVTAAITASIANIFH